MNWHKCLWKLNIRLARSHPDRALGGNSPVLKSVLSLAEVEQLIEHSHPGGKFRRRKASFTLRNSYYCDKVAELIGWAAFAVFFLPLQMDAAAARLQHLHFISRACVCKAEYEYRPLTGTGCRSYCGFFAGRNASRFALILPLETSHHSRLTEEHLLRVACGPARL